jgi:cbb3-type cytochrome oxidase subunit 1
MLYIVNHLSIPTSLLHSYPVFGGVQDGSCNGGMGTTPWRSS